VKAATAAAASTEGEEAKRLRLLEEQRIAREAAKLKARQEAKKKKKEKDRKMKEALKQKTKEMPEVAINDYEIATGSADGPPSSP